MEEIIMKRTLAIVAVLTSLVGMTACSDMHRNRGSDSGYDSGGSYNSGSSTRGTDRTNMDPTNRQNGGQAGGVQNSN
jgi:hypothetical protein